MITGATVNAPMATASGPYRNCTEAHRDGRYNIPKGDPDYRPGLDRDNDGLACEG
ncbi:excalibur calcium-binding domain-containing protein [Mycobacterium sp. 663a-19]|nr:excalibur calcium-binding domain-containing protein [Mycobacterium sp. 663a-19]MEB3981439.1 excalibur calcium-binding domain-containing protein [Mycobacterium sp. 663a-19]